MEEKVFTINLRREGLDTARWRKSHRSSFIVRNFLTRHMKVENIKIGNSINEEIWSRGNQKPPAKIKIKVIKVKDDDGNDLVKAEMWGHVFEEEIKEEKPKEKRSEEKKESKKEETKEKPKEQLKSEKKETKSESKESTDK